MFAPAYFGPRHFAPRYFAPALDIVRRIVGGDDAPGFAKSGRARRYIRYEALEAKDSIEAAIRAIKRARRKPTKKAVKKAVNAINKAVAPDPYDLGAKIRIHEAQAQLPDIAGLQRALRQLQLILDALKAFQKKEKQEEEAIIALLLTV